MRSFRRWLDDFRHPTVRRGRPEAVWLRLIERLVPSRTFVDIGCMWNVNGSYAFHALASGAAEVTGVDINSATPEFEARNRAEGGRVRLLKGRDPAKDQSYFLFGLTPAQLETALFPVGDLDKAEVRRVARARELPVADTAERQ